MIWRSRWPKATPLILWSGSCPRETTREKFSGIPSSPTRGVSPRCFAPTRPATRISRWENTPGPRCFRLPPSHSMPWMVTYARPFRSIPTTALRPVMIGCRWTWTVRKRLTVMCWCPARRSRTGGRRVLRFKEAMTALPGRMWTRSPTTRKSAANERYPPSRHDLFGFTYRRESHSPSRKWSCIGMGVPFGRRR